MKSNLLTWIALLLLCAVSLLARGAVGLILGAAGLKCGTLGWRYMELRSAHWFWRLALLGLVALVLATLGVLLDARR